jgi:hypothetical protein
VIVSALTCCARYPSVACASCGTKIVVPSPVVVLRAGDPVPVLFCATVGDQAYMNALSGALQEYATDERGGAHPNACEFGREQRAVLLRATRRGSGRGAHCCADQTHVAVGQAVSRLLAFR